MILSLVFLFLFSLFCSLMIFFFFAIFIPALKLKFSGTEELLSSDEFSDFSDQKANLDFLSHVNPGRFAQINAIVEEKIDWIGEKNCALYKSVYGVSVGDDGFVQCIGYGDCARACEQQAILIKGDRIIVTDSCDGCGFCEKVCPLDLISFVQTRPTEQSSHTKFWSRIYEVFKKD